MNFLFVLIHSTIPQGCKVLQCLMSETKPDINFALRKELYIVKKLKFIKNHYYCNISQELAHNLKNNVNHKKSYIKLMVNLWWCVNFEY